MHDDDTENDSSPSILSDKKIYFQHLHIDPIKINLSYASTPASEQLSPAATDNRIVKTILSAIGITVANIDGAQITLNTLDLMHPFSTQRQIINRVAKHYYMQLVREVSLSFLTS